MIYLIISILISCFSNAEEPTFQKSILKDNWQLGGGVSYYSDDDSNYSFSISPSVQYFFWDHISIGPILGYSNSRTSDSVSLGVAGTYYFFEEGSFVWSFSQAIEYSYIKFDFTTSPNSLADLEGSSSLNLSYFLSPHVAFGPSFSVRYFFDRDEDWSSSGTTSFLVSASFDIYF